VRNTKKSSQRLREALVDANLSIPMLLLMGQQRDCIVYRDGSKRHLKLVGMLFDNVSVCIETRVLECLQELQNSFPILLCIQRFAGWLRASLHRYHNPLVTTV
jgi:hypothetical protein